MEFNFIFDLHLDYSKDWEVVFKELDKLKASKYLRRIDNDTWERVHEFLRDCMYNHDNPWGVYEKIVDSLCNYAYDAYLTEQYEKTRKRLKRTRNAQLAGAKAYIDAIKDQSYTKPECPHRVKYLIEAWESGYSEASRKHSHSQLVESEKSPSSIRFVI